MPMAERAPAGPESESEGFFEWRQLLGDDECL